MKLCECGCGEPTVISSYSLKSDGRRRGEPIRFIKGHAGRRPLLDRLMEKVIWNGDEDECWEFQGCQNAHGYGRIGINRETFLAHRIAYELFIAPIPDDLCVLHRCDNPPCVNPAHLWLGTQAENMGDMAAKQRSPLGEKQGRAKLTASQVREIRGLIGHLPGRSIAERFNVSEQAISCIKHRRNWTHI